MVGANFSETDIYIALGVESDNTYIINQAFEFFRNRLVRKPKDNIWFIMPGYFSEAVIVNCVNDNNILGLDKVAASRVQNGRGGARLNIGDNEFWFAQCSCGAIYYARKG